MDAKTDERTRTAANPLASHHVCPDEMGWDTARFPGCATKTLFFDKDTGVLTALFKMEPGAVLPDHEHTLIEQTYVLEGSLVDKEGPDAGLEIGPGEFVWRPAGSRHSAWAPNGGLFLAIFQMPNKFFEKDGKVLDPTGQDWQAKWGAAMARRAAERKA
jgi:anti-sigma factor ChrR (cupin superfamily)